MYFFQDFLIPPAVPSATDFEGAADYISLNPDVLGHTENIAV
jgi:hypothetical protein